MHCIENWGWSLVTMLGAETCQIFAQMQRYFAVCRVGISLRMSRFVFDELLCLSLLFIVCVFSLLEVQVAELWATPNWWKNLIVTNINLSKIWHSHINVGIKLNLHQGFPELTSKQFYYVKAQSVLSPADFELTRGMNLQAWHLHAGCCVLFWRVS